MSSVIRNSWPLEIANDEVVSPETIMRHQAQELESFTNGLLTGSIAKTTAQDRIVLALEVDAPVLETTVKLFECQYQSLCDYPVLVVPPDPLPAYLRPRIIRKAKPVVPGSLQMLRDAMGTPNEWIDNKWLASDPVEFADKIESVIRSPEVKSILLSLIARTQQRQEQSAET